MRAGSLPALLKRLRRPADRGDDGGELDAAEASRPRAAITLPTPLVDFGLGPRSLLLGGILGAGPMRTGRSSARPLHPSRCTLQQTATICSRESHEAGTGPGRS